jgi:23S rRNA pseudouridine1911/1915/1917 synthase
MSNKVSKAPRVPTVPGVPEVPRTSGTSGNLGTPGTPGTLGFEIMVPLESDGLRLDKFLADEVPNQSRAQIQRLIEDGHVTFARVKALRANTTVRAGDVIAVVLPAPTAAVPTPEDLPLTVVFEDSDLLVIDKPAGMVVHPGAGHPGGTLVNALLHHVRDLSGIGGELRPGIVHRLDKGTSGVIVIAKHDAAHRELARQFQDREVEKEYVALVWGVVQQGKRIDLPLGRDPLHREKISTRARRARTAVTRVTWARHLPGVSLLRVAIATGRTHQIRVHLSAIGHPIVGDALYGGVRRRVPAALRPVLRLERPFLHAERLALTHPRTGQRLEFIAPIPADLSSVIADIVPEEMAGTVLQEWHVERHQDGTRRIDPDDLPRQSLPRDRRAGHAAEPSHRHARHRPASRIRRTASDAGGGYDRTDPPVPPRDSSLDLGAPGRQPGTRGRPGGRGRP